MSPTPASPTRFHRACLGQPVDRVPVWLMRQAGRYMPEYQAVRADAGGFHELCKSPKHAAQATLDAARILGTDAAIIFSDITMPGEPMGLELVFEPGPRFKNPLRTDQDLRRVRDVDAPRDLGYVMDAIRLTRAALPADVSLIGFVGAPFTLAGYFIEGDPSASRGWRETKRLAYGEPELMHGILERVTRVVTDHARAQIAAGCDAIQLFDSTAGELAHAELRAFAFHYAKRVIHALADTGVPIIYFARQIGAHLEEAAALGAHVLGLDWTVTLGEARSRLPANVTLMGNLDPATLFTSRAEVERRTRAILDESRGMQGFVFNLGHGVLPGTPVENVKQVIETVHGWR